MLTRTEVDSLIFASLASNLGTRSLAIAFVRSNALTELIRDLIGPRRLHPLIEPELRPGTSSNSQNGSLTLIQTIVFHTMKRLFQ